MSEILLSRPHRMSLKKARTAAQKVADQLAEEYDVQSHWDGDTLRFVRSGVDGSLHITAHELRLQVKLGFLLAAFRPAIQARIEQSLDRFVV